MKLSKRDDDLLYLVNHGERSALEERVLRGKLVTAGLKIQPGQMATHPNDVAEYKKIADQEKQAMLARAYRIVHASVGDTVTKLEIERLFGQLLDASEGETDACAPFALLPLEVVAVEVLPLEMVRSSSDGARREC